MLWKATSRPTSFREYAIQPRQPSQERSRRARGCVRLYSVARSRKAVSPPPDSTVSQRFRGFCVCAMIHGKRRSLFLVAWALAVAGAHPAAIEHVGVDLEVVLQDLVRRLHGVGVTCVNALSEWLEVEVRRDGHVFTQEYAQGVPTTPVTSGMTFCCESRAFTCTMEIFALPTALPFITRPSSVPLPFTPCVFGWRVAEIIACPCSVSTRCTIAIR